MNCLSTAQLPTETLTLSSLQKLRQSGETVVHSLFAKSASGKEKYVCFSICTIVCLILLELGGMHGRGAMRKDYISPEKATLRDHLQGGYHLQQVLFCPKIEFTHTTDFL